MRGKNAGVSGDVADEYEDTDFSQADDAMSAIDNSGTQLKSSFAPYPSGASLIVIIPYTIYCVDYTCDS